MTIIRVKGFKIFQDRHRHWRCYHRKTGFPIDLKKTPIGSAEFIAECAKNAALGDKAIMEKSGTLGLLILKRSTLHPHEGQADRPNTPSDSVNLGSNPCPPAIRLPDMTVYCQFPRSPE